MRITTGLAAVLLSLSVLAQPALAGARPGVPIENIENTALPVPAGREPTLAAVETALNHAAARKNWTLENQGPGKAVGTLVVRGKHTIRVDIAYTPRTISLTYKDSINMNYEVYSAPISQDTVTEMLSSGSRKYADGQPLIHPNYNVWVRDFLKQIKLEISVGTP